MLVLFETPAGLSLFKVLDEKKITESTDFAKDFETPEGASKIVKLKAFKKFKDNTDALAAATGFIEGKIGKGLKKFLKKVVIDGGLQEQIAVQDATLGKAIKDSLDLPCVTSSAISELYRGIRQQAPSLLGISEENMGLMSLGLAHSLSRYKLKFSPDKVDTMIIQAISLLDDIDKELNNYIMRCREWYGWHFPELTKIITDNLVYAKVVQALGERTNATGLDLSEFVTEEIEIEIKKTSEISMGTEISEEDIMNIQYLCTQITTITDYRSQLYEYLKNRMNAIAPNLTILVGELVGARLIAHAGSLINLAKYPSSTVQILGAEKALFRALKTKHDTPKYGLIYHASLIGQSQPKHKGKISRMLAAKASLAIRYDALGEGESNTELAFANRGKIENRLKQLEKQQLKRQSGGGSFRKQFKSYENETPVQKYNTDVDVQLGKRKKESAEEETVKKPKIEVVTTNGNGTAEEKPVNGAAVEGEKKKKKKKKAKEETESTTDTSTVEKKKKKKKIKTEVAEA